MFNLPLKRQSVLASSIAVALTITLSACGGGGGGKGNPETPATTEGPNNNTEPDDPTSTGINGALSGYIYYKILGGKQIKLNLKTGIETEVPFLWESTDYDNRVNSFAVDSQNKKIVKAVSDHEFSTGYFVKIQTVNAQNELHSEFYLYGGASPYIAVSPDGSVLSIDWMIDARTRTISLFDRLGNELWAFQNNAYMDENGNTINRLIGYEWLPDSSGILLREGKSVHKISTRDLSHKAPITSFHNLPFSLIGVPRVSNDGQKLAFTGNVGTGNPKDNHIFISDINGHNIRQLTNSVNGESLPTWSSDGEYVFVQTGTEDFQILEPNSCSLALYAVRADSENAFLSPNIDSTSATAIPIKRQTSGGAIQQVCIVSNVIQPKWSF